MTKIILLLIFIICSSCAIQSRNEVSQSTNEPVTRVDPKYSLSKDRSELDNLRKDVPVEVKKDNDEKAFLLDLTAEFKYSPEVVREKFNTLVRKKRDSFNKDMSKSRDLYNKTERKMRDDFLKKSADERKEFLKERVDSERRAEFFNEQDENRRNFFQEQREKRDEYESDVREKRKDFEDYLKEKQDDFFAEIKDYTVRWREYQKQKDEQKASPPSQ